MPSRMMKGAEVTGVLFDEAVVVRRAAAGLVGAFARVPVRRFGPGRVGVRVEDDLRDVAGVRRDVAVVRVMRSPRVREPRG